MKTFKFSVIVYKDNKEIFVGYMQAEAYTEEEAKRLVHEEALIDYPSAGNIVIKPI